MKPESIKAINDVLDGCEDCFESLPDDARHAVRDWYRAGQPRVEVPDREALLEAAEILIYEATDSDTGKTYPDDRTVAVAAFLRALGGE